MKNVMINSEIQYCILHGWESLPNYMHGDLDIILDPKALGTLERFLLDSNERRLVQLLQHESSGFYFVLMERKNGEIHYCAVDAATDYRRDGRVFFTAHGLLANRRQWKGFWVAAPRAEFMYLIVKKVLKEALPEHQRQRFSELISELGDNAYDIVRKLFGQKWGDRVIPWVQAENSNAFEANLRHLKRALLWQSVRHKPFNPLRYWLPETKRIWTRWRYPTGLFVALLGPDGAGKSTLIQHLRANLNGAFRRTELFHLRPGFIGKPEADSPVTDPHAKPPYPLWRSLLKIPYYLVDYRLGYLCKMRLKLVRSTLVLFDRYYQDLLVDPKRYRYGGPQWPVRLAGYLIPRPDVFLILDASEDQLLTRKREVSPEELRHQRKAYRRLAANLPNAALLNASLSIEEVARNAREVALDYLHARYLQRRHLWFGNPNLETLNWLASIFFSGDKARFAFSKRTQENPKTEWQTHGTFGWLALKDGRGYLLPLDSRHTSVSALRIYNAQHWKARFAKRLLTISLKGGISWPLLRKVQVFIRRDVPEQARGKSLLLEHLKEVLERRDLTFAISLGTPGAHRKPVVQVLTQKGQVLGYAKIGWNVKTDALVRNEADVLQRLAGTSFASFTVPLILFRGQWGNHFLCIQSASDGLVDHAPQLPTSNHLTVLNEIKALQTRWLPLEASAFWMNLSKKITNIQSPYYRQVLQQGTSKVEAWFGHKPLPFHFCHGDLTPWNTRLLNGRLFIFDWEYAASEMPPGWDLLHFLIQTMWLLNQWSPLQICHAFQRDEIAWQWIARFLGSLGVGEEALQPLLLSYLVERLAFYASEESANFQKLQRLAMMVNLCLYEEKSR